MTRIQLPRTAIIKSPGLLPMLYTVSEISATLDIPERTLRDWLLYGAPHTRDTRGHIWIHGREFASWIAGMRTPKKEKKLEDDEAYCMRCNKAVQMTGVVSKSVKGKLILISGTCPACGCKINRGGRVPTYNSDQTSWRDSGNAK